MKTEPRMSHDPAERYRQAVLLYPSARVSVWCIRPKRVEVINDLVQFWPTTEKIHEQLKKFVGGGTYEWEIRDVVFVAEGEGNEPAHEVPGIEIARGTIVMPDLGMPDLLPRPT